MFRDRDLPLRLAAALLPPRLGYALARASTPLLGRARVRHVADAVAAAVLDLLGDAALAARAGDGFAASIACDDLDALTAWLWPRRLRLRSVEVEGGEALPPPGRAIFVSFHLGGGFRVFDVLAARGFRPAVLAAPPVGGNRYDRLLARARLAYWRRTLGERLLLVGPQVPRAELRTPAPHLASGGAVVALLDVAPAALGLRDVGHATLFGRALAVPNGILRLAAGASAPVVPFDGRIEGGRRVLRFHAPIVSRDAQELTERVVRVFEGVIRARPWDWQGWLDARRLLGEPAVAAPSSPLSASSVSSPARVSPPSVVGEAASGRSVDVVVPVFDARADVERCLASLLAHATGDARLIVVDDASTDPELVAWLDRLAAREPRVVLLRNPANLGFVRSANRGMDEARGRDVVLLNSDTAVPPGFLERLQDAARSSPRTGIVSPFTNNGTILSLPEFMRDNPLPEGLDVDAFDALVRGTSPRARPEIVTAHGFCMYVRREVLDRVGSFDADAFGHGYSEENDLCERARAAGFEVRLCDDLFVYHRGRASFGGGGEALLAANLETLGRRHPGYHERVQRFIRENPLDELQAVVKYHLARRGGRRFPAMLFLLHADPFADPLREPIGGTQLHVLDLVRGLALPRALVAHPEGGDLCVAEIAGGDAEHPALHRFPDPAPPGSREAAGPAQRFRLGDAALERRLDEVVGLFDVGAAHLHHLSTWPLRAWRVLRARAVPYAWTVHDYSCLCPDFYRLNLRTLGPCACADGSAAEVRSCLDAWYRACDLEPPSDAAAAVRRHRAEFGELLAGAAAVIAPSSAARQIVARGFPGLALPWHVISHATPPGARNACPQVCGARPLRVALLGAPAAPWKGAEATLAVMRATRDLPLEWHVFGDAAAFGFPERARDAVGPEATGRLRFHGRYRREEIAGLLGREQIAVSLLLSPWDESFSLTLSESWAAGVPAIVSDRGAPAERVRESGAGIVASTPEAAAAALCELATEPAALRALADAACTWRGPSLEENAARHRAAYGPMLARLEPRPAAPPWGAADCALFAAFRRASRR